MTVEHLSQASFAEHLHTTFSLVYDTDQTLSLQLVEVREGRSSSRQVQFALLLRGPLTPALGQGTWPLHHAAMGDLALFLVPVDRDEESFFYEAVFNQLLPAAGSR